MYQVLGSQRDGKSVSSLFLTQQREVAAWGYLAKGDPMTGYGLSWKECLDQWVKLPQVQQQG